jgi:hypothetical protein
VRGVVSCTIRRSGGRVPTREADVDLKIGDRGRSHTECSGAVTWRMPCVVREGTSGETRPYWSG